jgi:integrase
VAWEYLSRDPLRDSQGQAAEGLKPLREPQGRVRFLAADEIARLLAACEPVPYLKPFAIVALNTGMRRNEILSLTRRTIDWTAKTAALSETVTKNGKSRVVFLNEAAFAALASLPTRIDGRLFPLGPNQISIAFKRAVDRAEIADFRLHDLRHCFASAHVMSGTPQRAIQSLLGHSDGRMTERYSHVNDEFLKAAIDRVAVTA